MRFADIVGHRQVIDRLQQTIAANRLPHTYLFAGPEGIGKCVTARALAAALLCEQAGADGCGTCTHCVAAARETHPDLVVVRMTEGAQEIKIDQARELQRRLRLKPIRATRKVAIVDDAHRLNLAAQHAMLKTFEEPPGATVLVLVASNVATLLPTVLSRCQRVNFFPLEDRAVEQLLVAQCEIPAAEARELALYGEGSVSQALLFRSEVMDRARAEILPLLENLPQRAYADLAGLAQEWGRLQTSELLLLLHAPLFWYRERLATTLESGGSGEAAVVLSQLRIVYDSIERLRRNAHRQLTLDAMLIGLQRAARARGPARTRADARP